MLYKISELFVGWTKKSLLEGELDLQPPDLVPVLH